MGSLWNQIRASIEQERFVVGVHAALRLRQRRILIWQVVTGSLDATLLAEHSRSRPNPSVEIEVLLPDGEPAKVVWSWLADDSAAKLVTVHFYDR